MTTVVAEAIRYAINNSFKSVNLSTWPDESKLRWRPDEVRYVDAVCVRQRPFARLAYSALQPETRARLKKVLLRG
jgi:hypothetical protein